MQIESVNCNSCGAPLEVGATTKFVTCVHCGSRLAIKRTASSAFTETLEKLDQKTDAMAQQLAELRFHAELEKIDREWEQERQSFLTTDKQGGKHEPNAAAGMIGGAIAAGFGLIWTIAAFSMTTVFSDGGGAPVIFNCFPLFGLLFIGMGIWMFIKAPSAAANYDKAKADYRRRREALSLDQFLPKD